MLAGDRTLTTATVVFDRVFGAEGPTAGVREACSRGGVGDDSPLDSLVDFARLFVVSFVKILGTEDAFPRLGRRGYSPPLSRRG